jgi:hypothetical protein
MHHHECNTLNRFIYLRTINGFSYTIFPVKNKCWKIFKRVKCTSGPQTPRQCHPGPRTPKLCHPCPWMLFGSHCMSKWVQTCDPWRRGVLMWHLSPSSRSSTPSPSNPLLRRCAWRLTGPQRRGSKRSHHRNYSRLCRWHHDDEVEMGPWSCR